MTRRWKTNEQPTHKVLHDQIILHHIMQKLTIIITAPSNWNKETSSVKPNWAWDYEIMVGEITWSPESNWLLGTNARCCIGWHHDRSVAGSMDCRWRDRQYVATDVGAASWFHVPSVWQRRRKTWVPGVCQHKWIQSWSTEAEKPWKAKTEMSNNFTSAHQVPAHQHRFCSRAP